jgi:hypothetical protein
LFKKSVSTVDGSGTYVLCIREDWRGAVMVMMFWKVRNLILGRQKETKCLSGEVGGSHGKW